MKKLCVLILFFAITTRGLCQISREALLVGGSSSAAFQSINAGGSSQTLFNINTKLGYFVSENLALGINLNYLNFAAANQFAFGGFGRYYVSGKYFFGAGLLASKVSKDRKSTRLNSSHSSVSRMPSSA